MVIAVGLAAAGTSGCGTSSVLRDEDQVFVADVSGGDVRRVTDGSAHTDPSWSPDSRRFAVAAGRSLETVDVETATTRTVYASRVRTAFPAWSPRGRPIAFLTLSGTEGTVVRLQTVSPVSRASRVLAAFRSDRDSGAPTWSPDGRRIAFARPAGSFRLTHPSDPLAPSVDARVMKIFVVDINERAGALRVLAAGGHDEFEPHWSPDGRSIAFIRWHSRSRFEVVVARARGGGARVVAHNLLHGSISWSPDARRLALSAVVGKGDFRAHPYLVDLAAGGELRRLTSVETAVDAPTWSPAGDRIAFADYDGRVRTLAVRERRLRTVATLAGAEIFGLSWSPDGKRLAFSARKARPED